MTDLIGASRTVRRASLCSYFRTDRQRDGFDQLMCKKRLRQKSNMVKVESLTSKHGFVGRGHKHDGEFETHRGKMSDKLDTRYVAELKIDNQAFRFGVLTALMNSSADANSSTR